jgi:ubiquinone/menaquinone biosynthesis C-methylase UbiE
MQNKIDLYNTAYDNFAQEVERQVRAETYGEDLGQTGWMTAEEFRRFLGFLELKRGARLLEVGFGSGGCSLYAAEVVGLQVTGIDINENGVRNARELADSKGLAEQVWFERIDASRPLPFADSAFDAIFSNDSMCHLDGRDAVLKEWHRVLAPSGRVLFSDAMVMTGILTSEELAIRSSIGHYLFLPMGENERLIKEAGFTLLRADDLTASAETIARNWHDARERRREELIRIEGETNFRGLQNFLSCVHRVSKERRLSRYAYLALKALA